jgi:hypothetical protein
MAVLITYPNPKMHWREVEEQPLKQKGSGLSIMRNQYSIWPRIKSICHLSIVRLNHIFKIVNNKIENTKSERNKICDVPHRLGMRMCLYV